MDHGRSPLAVSSALAVGGAVVALFGVDVLLEAEVVVSGGAFLYLTILILRAVRSPRGTADAQLPGPDA